MIVQTPSSSDLIAGSRLPEVTPLDQWEATYDTLHLMLQIVGKVRLMLMPKSNHWWHVPFYLSVHGLTTEAIPFVPRDAANDGVRLLEITFDFTDHLLRLQTSHSQQQTIALADVGIGDFHQQVMHALTQLGVDVSILAEPYDVPDISTTPFADSQFSTAYDAAAVERMWQVLIQVDALFEIFRGRFVGKSTPVHLFWHHFDLALTRFNGDAALQKPDAGQVEQEAYSHEVISFGFWFGDKQVRRPAFYAYAAPVPDGLFDTPLRPPAALWSEDAGMALLFYDDIRHAPDAGQQVLDFLQSSYEACAQQLGWDISAFELASWV